MIVLLVLNLLPNIKRSTLLFMSQNSVRRYNLKYKKYTMVLLNVIHCLYQSACMLLR